MSVNEALRAVGEETWDGSAFPPIEPRIAGIGTADSEAHRLAKYSMDLWSLGFSDGLAGQPAEDNVALIRQFASRRKTDRLIKLGHELAVSESEKAVADQARTDLQTAIGQNTRKRDALLARREKKPHEFSPLSGAAFLIVSLMLILSDIPLTIQFVGQALDMADVVERPDESGNIQQLHIVNMIFGPMRREAALALWEVAALALGIAMLGMFFKLTADFLLGDSEFFSRYPWLVHIRPALQAVFFLTAFILVCRTLWSMGALRAAVSTAKHTHGAIPPALVNMTYTMLAIALPVIGGICFSLGQKRLQNWWELLTTRIQLFRNRRATLKVAGSVAMHAAQSEFLSEAIKRELAAADTASVPEKMYTHAHHRGARSFERPDQSLHDRCMALVYRAMAAGVR
jgi:hypothetical protein